MIAGLGWQSCLSHHLSSLYEFMMVFDGLLVMAVCVCVYVCAHACSQVEGGTGRLASKIKHF